jgi:hypothetical protein
MLPVAIHEQDGAETGMIEPGEQRRLLAEIARQRDDLDIETVGRKLACGGERPIAAAVVDIDDLGGKAASRLERARDIDNASVQRGEIVCLIEQGNHDGDAGVRPAARTRRSAADSSHRLWSHRPPLSLRPAAGGYSPSMGRCRAGELP